LRFLKDVSNIRFLAYIRDLLIFNQREELKMPQAIQMIVEKIKQILGFGHTVDSVTAAFTKTVDNLKRVEEKEKANAERHIAAIRDSQIAHAASLKEMNRANSIASKIGEIVGQV
jgi:hypothetical protein